MCKHFEKVQKIFSAMSAVDICQKLDYVSFVDIFLSATCTDVSQDKFLGVLDYMLPKMLKTLSIFQLSQVCHYLIEKCLTEKK